MAKFHKLKVSDVTRETEECVSIAFEIPDSLKSEYKYIQGQYLTIKLDVNGEEIRRSYSICSSPVLDKDLRVAIKRVKDGRGSNYLNEKVKPGDQLEVMTPMGNFYSQLSEANKKNYVLFAGGSGITPMLSIIKTTLHTEPGSKIVLFYGNRDEASVIFKKQFEELIAKHSDRLKVYHILEKPSDPATSDLLKGLLTPEKTKALIENYIGAGDNSEFFICGPSAMMDCVKNALHHLNIADKQIHIEYFTASPDQQKVAVKVEDTKHPFIESQVTVILDGEETTFTLKPDGPAILDAALDADMDVPFACKGAVCCTCRAKLIEGKVHMDMNYALSDAEVAAGFILTCQSHPLTPVVKVDYDV
jgi:ring-1,2-phenylacetyl-CoA epoxidase subunit PaaE